MTDLMKTMCIVVLIAGLLAIGHEYAADRAEHQEQQLIGIGSCLGDPIACAEAQQYGDHYHPNWG